MINVAILGCGEMGQIHARCLAGIDQARVVACCDVAVDRAQALAAAAGGAYATDDAGRVLRDDRVDAVYICTRHDTHSDLAVRAAEAGKHILMEKPLALTLADCHRVGEAVERTGVTLMTGFKLRYYPAVRAVRAFVPRPLVTIAQLMDARWPSDFWANDPVQGGGNVLSQGCHLMDLVCHLNDDAPVRIYAEGGNFTHPDLPIVDNLVATLSFARGGVASIAIGDSGRTPFVSKFSFQVLDGLRTAHLHDRLKRAVLFDGAQVREHADPDEYGFEEENRDFIRALAERRPPPITHRDGLRATLLVLRAFESLRTRTPQPLAFITR
jgi:predicted dehydrogenase